MMRILSCVSVILAFEVVVLAHSPLAATVEVLRTPSLLNDLGTKLQNISPSPIFIEDILDNFGATTFFQTKIEANQDSDNNPHANSTISEDEKKWIDILFHEYDSLRDKLRQKDASFVGSLTIMITLISGSIAFAKERKNYKWLLLAVAIMFLFLFFLIAFVDAPSKKITARLRELEAEINGLAHRDLLIWETSQGNGGFFDRRHQHPPR